MNKGSFIGLFAFFLTGIAQAQVNNPGQVANDAATNQANNDMYNAANNGVNKAEQGLGSMFKKKNKPAKADTVLPARQNANPSDQADAGSSPQNPSLKVYANYDFVPGDKIIFEDNFSEDRDAEFPTHWELEKGQAILNKIRGTESFFITDGNYARVSPLIKNKSYLTNQFTVEYDLYNPDNGSYGLMLFFKDNEGGDLASVQVTPSEVNYDYTESRNLNASLPAEIQSDNFKDRWHHVAIAYNNKQMKVYADQYRVLYVPNADITPASLDFGGIGDQTNPIIFRNVRIASGGGMNMVGQKFTDAKIVTHGINFEIDKATILPESMGTLNMVAQVMKDNPDIKFDVEGFTDNTGTPTHNLTLSQQRADAVKAQLVSMGIPASRLTTKGFGDTKPISDNNTPEGRANNRRVEFVKM
jgi:OmpA-OmpF porin, OOP family